MNVQISQIERQTLEKNFQSNNFDKVEKNLHSLFTRATKNVGTQFTCSKLCKAKRNLKELITFLKIIELEPNDFDHYFNLANLYKKTEI